MSQHMMCRCCGQPLPPQERAGVHLPAKKAAIFDTIDRHPGITALGIIANCWPDKMSVKVVHSHVAQINDLMAGTGVKIRGEKRGGWNEPGGYRIIRRSKR